MKYRRLLSLAIAVGTSLLVGCENLNSIFRTRNLGDGRSLVTDAKQRVVVNVAPGKASTFSGQINPTRIVCAEPSPDVAQALSEALKASVQYDRAFAAPSGETPGSRNVGVEFGRSVTASVAQLGERLAAIQLLRDKMYRACEAYANGAVTSTGYTLMLARLDKTMATLLATEIAGGAFGRALAVIGGAAGTGGVDEAELAKQQQAVTKQAEALKNAAKGDKPDEKKIKEEADKLDAEVAKLVALERAAARTSAGSMLGFGQPGSISGSRSIDPGAISEIHRNYLDDDGVDPLVDACIVSMDRIKLPPDAQKALASAVEALESAVRDVKDRPKENDAKERLNQASDALAALAKDWDSPFAIFCAKNVIAGSSSFIRDREKATLDRRRLAVDLEQAAIGRDVKKTELCMKIASASDKELDKETRQKLLAQCLDTLKSAAK